MGKGELESLLSKYNSEMGLATIVIAIGIFGDYIARFLFDREKRSRREWISTTVFFACILGGTLGGYWFGEKLSQTSSKLQRLSDGEVATAQRDAEQAKAQAAASDLARVQLEKSMEWRHLTPEQVKSLCAAIPRTLDNRWVNIGADTDLEAQRYASEFASVWRKCTESSEHPFVKVPEFPPPKVQFGVWVKFGREETLDHPDQNSVAENFAMRRGLARSIARTLKSSGVDIAGVDNGGGVLEIHIGPRKPPALEAPAIP